MKWMSLVFLTVVLCSCATTRHAPGEKAGGDTELICHKGKKTMELPQEAIDAHIGHGDRHGPCSAY